MCGGDVSRCHTSKKEYHECTDTMAQMKNKINETKECLQCVFREYAGAINRLPTVGVCRGMGRN